MIRALFFDLDGTLLGSDKKIPASARRAIVRAKGAGVHTFFATARSPALETMLGWTQAEFSLFSGAIYSNGGCVHFQGREEYRFIDPRAVRLCMARAAAFADVHYSMHLPGDEHAFNFPADASMCGDWGLSLDKVVPADDAAAVQTVKMLLFYGRLTDNLRVLPAALFPALRAECEGLARVYLSDGGRAIQITGMEAGKLTAIEHVRRQLGLSEDEIAVFGDDANDLEMIRHYRHSVAMGNAVPAVKEAAGFVTEANDADGVALALERLLPAR